MKHQHDSGPGSVVTDRIVTNRKPSRIAVVGAGVAGLTCARELWLRGHDPVVFEALDRLGGRSSSRITRSGVFDDGAQCFSGTRRLASYAVQRPGELAAIHSWTVPAVPGDDHHNGRDWGKDDGEADAVRALKVVGEVGVPAMRALADAIARPLNVRLLRPIQQARRRGAGWVLRDAAGEIDEDFRALVLAVPAPLALPLALESAVLSAALRTVRYSSRWVLLLGSDRAVGLPGYRVFHGSPIERVAAMHCKPGRCTGPPQRWFVEADERWSLQHEHDDAETVADLLLDNFRAHAGRSVTPNYLRAHQWRHAFVETPAVVPGRSGFLWDEEARLGVCGDSVVSSEVDRAHGSGVALARAMAGALASRRDWNAMPVPQRDHGKQFEAQV